MNLKINTYYLKALSAIILLVVSTSVISQQILNVTEIPHDIVSYTNIEEIRKEGNIYYVPVFRAKNDIFEYLPVMEVDSFHTPIDYQINQELGSTLYLEYTPNIGFTEMNIVNYRSLEKKLSFENDNICLSAYGSAMGINDQIIYEYPNHPDSFIVRQNIVAVYNSTIDSIIYFNSFAEGPKYKLSSAIDGDFVYLNIPLTYSEDEDLIFMGDTLTYPFNTHGTVGCNYLSKINYITGEKIWTHHIGYGDVEKIVIDEVHRVNIDMVTGVPVMLDFEMIHENSQSYYGQYDRLIYRMSPDGEYLDDTYIHTYGAFAIYEVEINQDGSFQAFGGVTYPMYVLVEGDSLDFTDAFGDANNKAIVLVYDEDLQYTWGKKISSLGSAYHTAMNKNPNGDYILSAWIEGTQLTIDDVVYDGPPDPELTDDHYGSVLMRLDKDGNLLGDPVFCTHRNRIQDIQALEENHFLILFEKFGVLGLDFLGEKFQDGWRDKTYVVEYEGDIYNLMTTVNEYFDNEKYSIWPNPAKTGQSINISVPDRIVEKTIGISLVSENGEMVDTKKMERATELKYTLPETATSGMYYILISTLNEKITIPITIY